MWYIMHLGSLWVNRIAVKPPLPLRQQQHSWIEWNSLGHDGSRVLTGLTAAVSTSCHASICWGQIYWGRMRLVLFFLLPRASGDVACGLVVVFVVVGGVVPLSVWSCLTVRFPGLCALSGPFTVHTASCTASDWAEGRSLKDRGEF